MNSSTYVGKEVNGMQKMYETPELTVLGEAHELVMGTSIGGPDFDNTNFGWDFEFAQD